MFRLFKIFFSLIGCLLFLFTNAQVHAGFQASVPAGCAPIPVKFTDTSKGIPAQWVWNFGNGDTSHQQNPQEIFQQAGSYPVKLIVSNTNSIDSVTEIITITGSVKAGFTYHYDNVCSAPSIFNFAAKNPLDTIAYSWNFGNSNTSAGSTTSTVFTTNGNYNVRLITTTSQGCSDTAAQTFTIGSATASFSSYSVVCLNAPATFTNTSNPNPLSINWFVNGVNAGNGNTLTYTFTTAGTYTVSIVAGFGTCTQTATKTITVKDKPVPGFSQTGNLQSCTYPVTINFTNTSTNANAYQWLFGDGNSSTQTNMNYTYQNAGKFSPALIAFNGDGCSDTLTKTDLIRLGPPVITGFTSLPKSGCIPEAITSGANISSPDPVTTYDWNTGDNSLHLSTQQFNHTYTSEGYYDVSLTVTTQNGCTGSYTLKQAVAAGTKPVANFTVDKSSVCAATPVNFIDESVGIVTSWNWNFGDGLSASGKNPSHLFTKLGANDVTLYVSDKGCSADPKTIPDVVTILPPIAKFGVTYNCADPLQVQFTDSSIQPTSWSWNFGNLGISTNQSPTYTYPASGSYQVVLTTSNSSSGCSSSDTATVIVTDQKPAIEVNPSASFICRNDSIRFSAVSNTNFILNYTWEAGDGSAPVHDSTLLHIYTKSGDYKPFVTVQYANKCKDSVYTNTPLHVYGPTAAFTAKQLGNCLPVDVTFTDKSTTDNSNAIDSTIWIYGDGNADNGNTGTHDHIYQTGGSFTPKLIIRDAVGCVDTAASPQPVTAKGATAGFTYNIIPSCDSAQVNFTGTSVPYNDSIASYKWTFGDGTNFISLYANLVYTYHTSGIYPVTLTVITKGGCTSVDSQNITIAIAAKPKLTITAPTVACIASDIALSASASGNNTVTQWTWDLGNGTAKNGQSISTIYNQPGTYQITLTAALEGSCADSSFQNITISDVPETNAGTDSFVCAGNTIALQASGAETYTWQQVDNTLSCTNCASPTAMPTTPTRYMVTGKNAAGCTSSDTVFVDVQNKEMLAVDTADVSICAGSHVQLSATGTDQYSWQPSQDITNASVSNPVASPMATTLYTVTGSDKRQCFTDTKQVTVTVVPLPAFNIVDSAITLPRGTRQLLLTTNSPDIVTWLWQPATGLSCSDCPTPELTATITGTYTATAYTANGCSDSDEIKVVLLCDRSGIFIPAAFTPNGDGKNDRFYPISFADSKVISFTIFSRGGEIIFQKQNINTNSYKDGWDGSYQSQPMPVGAYVYKMEVQCQNNITPFTGTVTLIR